MCVKISPTCTQIVGPFGNSSQQITMKDSDNYHCPSLLFAVMNYQMARLFVCMWAKFLHTFIKKNIYISINIL